MRTKKERKAFSLLELSIVIVIIGVLLVGVVGSKHLIKKSRIQAAQAITRSSPISAIKNNKLWLESSLDELSLGVSAEDFITSWEDNSSNNGISISVEEDGPKYSNSINGVQAVKFDSTSFTNHLKIDNPAFLNGTDYTIFVLEKRLDTNDSDGGNYLLGATGVFALGYETTSTVIQTHGEAASDGNQAAIESVDDYSNKPRMISFTHSSVDGNKIYINGTLANEDNSDEAKAHLAGFSSVNALKIGNNYNGEIGELVIFDRAIKNSEREEIEDYLSDKWNAPNNRESTPDCATGTILSTGCEASCSISIIGSSSDTSVSDGISGTALCDDVGYDSVGIDYTCSSGTTITGTCGCDAGYNLDSGTCQAQCDLADITGLTTLGVNSGVTDSQSCTSPGYTGTINYTCSNGTLSVNSGSCEAGCDVPTNIGVVESGTTVTKATTGTFSCDTSRNYTSDTLDYTCDSAGDLTITSASTSCDCDTTSTLSFLNDAGDDCVDIASSLWLDASNASTITESAGKVSQWNDLSGSGNDVSQLTSSDQPSTGLRTMNGLNVISFTPGNLKLSSPLIGADEDFTFFVVMKFTVLDKNHFIVSQYAGSGIHNDRTIFVSTEQYDNKYSFFKGGTFYSGSKTISTSENYLLYSAKNGNNISIAANGTGTSGTPFGDFAIRQANFEVGYTGVHLGDIAEIIGFNRSLTSTEKTNVENYLKTKWGL